MDERDIKEITHYIPTRRAAALRAARSRHWGAGWTTPLVVGVAFGALLVGLLVGLLAGVVVARDDPDRALAEAHQEIQARDESIGALESRVAILESELSESGLDAGRERSAERSLTGPSLDLPSVKDVITTFSRFNHWLTDTIGSLGGSLDDATRLDNPVSP